MKNYITAILTLVYFLNSSVSYAQNNSLVLNGAYIVMEGGNFTNNVNLVVNQPSPSGIIRLASGGHIHSENQYNYVKWITGSNTGNYIFPLGVAGNPNDYIPFTFNKSTGNSDVSVSTWSTNQQNLPKPDTTNVAPVTNMSGSVDSVSYALDRFWDIKAPATTADLTFSYRGIENTTITPNSIVMAQHWNGTSWDSQVGPGNLGITSGIGSAGPFIGQTTFSPWVLSLSCDATIDTNGITPFCINDSSINLTSTSLGGTWSGAGIIDSINGTFNPGTAGIGNHIVTYTLNCGDIDTILLTVNPKDVASFTFSQFGYCLSDSNPIPVITGTTGGFFTISNSGVINPITGEVNLLASGIGNFDIHYFTNGNCPDSNAFNITINNCSSPIANFNTSDTIICEGECINYTDLSTNANNWNWTLSGSNTPTSNVPNPTACYVTPGTYITKLIVSNSGVYDTTTQTITVIPTPSLLALGANTTINLGESTTLTASGSGGNYTWSPSTWLSCNFCQTTISTPEETTTYTITLDTNGCSVSDQLTVIVNSTNIIFVPNIFSPNGDGINDLVFVEGKTIETIKFFIYDRWGEKVFETTNKNKGWDGTFRGKKMNKAVFVYYVEATFKDGTNSIQKGDITLIR